MPGLETETSVEETFLSFLNRGSSPCDYERQLLEQQSERVMAILEGKLVPPYELEIQPASSCNLKCRHCFGKSYKKLPALIGKNEMIKIAEKVDEFRENGFNIDTVKFCGTTGEPLLNSATLDAIALFRELDKKVIVFTNGLLLDKEYNGARYYHYMLDANKLNISLDAGSESVFERLKGRNGLKRIINSISELVKLRDVCRSRVKIAVSYVIGRENYREIIKTTLLVKEIGADEIRFRVDFTDSAGVRELSQKIIPDLHQAKMLADSRFKVISAYSDDEISKTDSAFNTQGRKCFNHHFWASIGPDCNLYACGHRTHGNVASYGSLLEHSFKELWLEKYRQDEVSCLPNEHCKICSPSSVRRNDFMTFLSKIPTKELERLVKENAS